MNRLNLAAGNRVAVGDDWVNHDRWAHRPEINATHDLTEYPWPWEDGQFVEIIAFDIIEHVPSAIRFLEEIWRISAPDAKVYIHTGWAGPSLDSRHFWRDPTHVRPFHEDSLHYFDPVNGGFWYENYGKFYSPARFKIRQIDREPPDCIGYHLEALKD